MFYLLKPSTEAINRYLAAQAKQTYSYKEVGMTKKVHEVSSSGSGGSEKSTSAPAGYVLDQYEICLGEGQVVFDSAVSALKKWQQFDLGWINIAPANSSVAANSTVCPVVSLGPIWLLCACRVVYLIDEKGIEEFAGGIAETDAQFKKIRKYGFAYGTLPGHPEMGEELFTIEWNRSDNSVWYKILALSRPGIFLTQVGRPFCRYMQKRFGRESTARMLKAVSHKQK